MTKQSPVVFVVDDEAVIAETLAVILRKNGYSAISFTNPLQALEQATSQAPDLLVSDVVMPQLTGIELAIQLTTGYPNCKVLLFSGQASTNDLLETARQQGHNFQLLSKPVHPADLLRELKELHPESLSA